MALVKRHGMMLWLRLGFPSDDVTPNENTAKTVIIFVGELTHSWAYIINIKLQELLQFVH